MTKGEEMLKRVQHDKMRGDAETSLVLQEGEEMLKRVQHDKRRGDAETSSA